jgi:hypothetical protein
MLSLTQQKDEIGSTTVAVLLIHNFLQGKKKSSLDCRLDEEKMKLDVCDGWRDR